MKRPAIALAATLTSTSAVACTSEADVTLLNGGQEFVGTLCALEDETAPTVLLLHGFTGARDELPSEAVPEGVFAYTAKALADAGYQSLRIDFRGSGESLGDLTFEDTTFKGQIADAQAAVAYLADQATSEVYVIGWSQGGLVAAALAGRGADVAGVALWNAVADPRATYGALFGSEALEAAIAAPADEVRELALPWGVELTLKGAFFDDVAALDPLMEIASYGGPLLAANGMTDTLVAPGSGQAYVDANGGGTVYRADMDHVFDIFADASDLDAMIAATIALFDGS
ncbi:MAG: alpha/beta fold hydrolase [Pseudomonadota bacterium]